MSVGLLGVKDIEKIVTYFEERWTHWAGRKRMFQKHFSMPHLQEPFTDPPKAAEELCTDAPEVGERHSNLSTTRGESPKAAEKDKETPKVQFADPPRVNGATKVQQPPKPRPQPKKPGKRRSEEEDDPSYCPSRARAKSVAPSCERAKSVAPSRGREKSVPPSTSRAKSTAPRFERAKSVAPSVSLRDAVPVKPNTPSVEPAKSSMPPRSRAKSVAPSVNRASSVMPSTNQAKSNTNTPSARQEKLAAALARREKSPSPLSSQVSKILESLQRMENVQPSTSTPTTTSTTTRPNPSASTDISLPSSSAERELPDDDVVIIENEPGPTPRPFVPNTYFLGGQAKQNTATPTTPALPTNITVNGRTFRNSSPPILTPQSSPIPAPKQKKTPASLIRPRPSFPPPNIVPIKRQKVAETVPSDNENVADSSPLAKQAKRSFSIATTTPSATPNGVNASQPLTQFRPFRNPSAKYFAFEALPNLQLPPLPTHMNLRSTQVDLNLKCIRFAFVHHVEYYSYIIDFKKFKSVPLTCQLEFFNANTKMWDRQDCEKIETGNCSVGQVKCNSIHENMFFTVVCTDAAGRKTICPVIVVDKLRLNQRCEVVFEPDLIVIDDD
uniref:C-CAP/cofactor C-like domain-containing protein n=1 Tax=Panagrellus redivivus TaxID=6233 RepID=A0A7E4WBF9_PANRE